MRFEPNDDRRYDRDTADARVTEWFPDSYLFYPAKPERSEREQFVAAYEARAAAEPNGKNVWILKPSDGGKVRCHVVDSEPCHR